MHTLGVYGDIQLLTDCQSFLSERGGRLLEVYRFPAFLFHPIL